MEKTQNIQNSHYSTYVRGLVIGSLAGGTLVAGALAINSFVHSGTQIPEGTTATSILKDFSSYFSYGVINAYAHVVAPDVTKNVAKHLHMDPSTAKLWSLYALVNGLTGVAIFGSIRLTERLIERLL